MALVSFFCTTMFFQCTTLRHGRRALEAACNAFVMAVCLNDGDLIVKAGFDFGTASYGYGNKNRALRSFVSSGICSYAQ